MNDPYRIKIENGKITVSLFDKGNPIPYIHIKGPIYSERTIESLKEVRHKIGDKNAVRLINDFIFIGEKFSKKLNKDFN